MKKKSLAVFLCGLCLISFAVPTGAQHRYGRVRNRVEVRYRNAGERIADRMADRVLDKVLGPVEKKEKVFTPSVQSGYSLNGPLQNINEAWTKIEYPSGYRADTYTGSVDILSEVENKFISSGLYCLPYFAAEEAGFEKYPYGVVARVEEFNPDTVSCTFTVKDMGSGADVFGYSGRVSGKGMGRKEQDMAVNAIINDFTQKFFANRQ